MIKTNPYGVGSQSSNFQVNCTCRSHLVSSNLIVNSSLSWTCRTIHTSKCHSQSNTHTRTAPARPVQCRQRRWRRNNFCNLEVIHAAPWAESERYLWRVPWCCLCWNGRVFGRGRLEKRSNLYLLTRILPAPWMWMQSSFGGSGTLICSYGDSWTCWPSSSSLCVPYRIRSLSFLISIFVSYCCLSCKSESCRF